MCITWTADVHYRRAHCRSCMHGNFKPGEISLLMVELTSWLGTQGSSWLQLLSGVVQQWCPLLSRGKPLMLRCWLPSSIALHSLMLAVSVATLCSGLCCHTQAHFQSRVDDRMPSQTMHYVHTQFHTNIVSLRFASTTLYNLKLDTSHFHSILRGL